MQNQNSKTKEGLDGLIDAIFQDGEKTISAESGEIPLDHQVSKLNPLIEPDDAPS